MYLNIVWQRQETWATCFTKWFKINVKECEV